MSITILARIVQKFWKLNHTLLNNEPNKKGVTRKVYNVLNLIINYNWIYQNLWNAAKIVLRGNL